MCFPVLTVFLYDCGAVLGAHLGVRLGDTRPWPRLSSPGTLDGASTDVVTQGSILLDVIQFDKYQSQGQVFPSGE